MSYLNIIQKSRFKLYRFSKFKCLSYNTLASKDLFDVLEEKVEEDIGYDQWVTNTKEALKNSKGRFWLGKSSPFPFNSSFMPKPVLSDASKTKIFELFKHNPTINDHRSLAHKFKISVDRVKAILRQKELELVLAKDGKVVDKEFVAILESNLECVEIAEEPFEVKNYDKRLPFRPLFASVPEGRTFSFQDAKEILISKGINIKSPSSEAKSELNVPDINSRSNDSKTIAKSLFEKSRNKFVFVDISKTDPKKNSDIVFVRDCDGTLRTASLDENEYAINKTWNRNRPKLNQ